MGVIDLDQPPAARPVPARRRPGVLLAVGGALALGAVLGAAGTYGWTAHRQEAARAGEASVVVLAGTLPDDGGVGGTVLDGRVTDASLTRKVTLVNAGPLPIEVHGLRADRPGLTLRGTGRERRIPAGGSVEADADLRIVCRGGLPIAQLPLRISVRTVDAREHTVTATLDAARWNGQARLACTGELL